jgi:hypothetical protein
MLQGICQLVLPRLEIKRSVKDPFVPEYDRIEMLIRGLQSSPRDIYAAGNPSENLLFDNSSNKLNLKIHPFGSTAVILDEYKVQSLERHHSLL